MARNIGDENKNREETNADLNAGQESAPQSSAEPNGAAQEDDSLEAVLSRYIEADEQPVTKDEQPVSDEAPAKKEKKPKKRMAKGAKIAVTVVVIAVLAVAGTFAFLYLDNNRMMAADEETAIRDNGTIYSGVSILGIDLSGMTMDEARPVVQQAADEMINGLSIAYTVEGNEYTLNNQELGAAVDVEAALQQAIMFGRQGAFFDRLSSIESAEQSGEVIDLSISYNEQSILQALESNKDNMDVEAQDASVEMNPVSDEGNMITDMEITYVNHVVGHGVNRESLASEIYAAVSAGNFETVQAVVEDVMPSITDQDIEGLYTERGVFSTKFASSAEGRRYNIWKMSDIINGVKIEPGETWSINEEAGPRTYDRGWKGAPGISDGEYKTEAGGGICQVSSTLYNAVIRAEVEIVDRKHHSWPLDYVAGGLDATISTGAPDFVIKNNYDVPIYIIARCDGEGDRTVEVAIYGPPHEDGLTRDFTSELVSEWGAGGTVTIQDASLPAGTTQQIIQAHNGKKYEVYKHWVDADGNIVKTEHFSTEVYDAKPAKVRVGTGAAPAPETPAPTPETPAPTPETPLPPPETPAPETPTPETPTPETPTA